MTGLARGCPRNADANLRYQGALDWRKWTKGGCSFLLFCPFDRAFMQGVTICNGLPRSDRGCIDRA